MDNNKLKLDFIKRVITDTVGNDEILNNYFDNNIFPSEEIMQSIIKQPMDQQRLVGNDWPHRAHTMIGFKRLDNLHDCLDYVRENNIEGDFIETGVWRGGASIFAKIYFDLYGMNKKVFVADSFAGLPPPEHPEDNGDIHHTIPILSVSLEDVMNHFKMYKSLDDKVIFLKGWFADTLPNNTQIEKLCILRMDGDMYKSTMDVFDSCYHKLVSGGRLIIDDYCINQCKRAVHHFRERTKSNEPITTIDNCGIFWTKN